MKSFILHVTFLLGISFCGNAQNYNVGPANYKIIVTRLNVFGQTAHTRSDLTAYNSAGVPISVAYTPEYATLTGYFGVIIGYVDTILVFQPQFAPASLTRYFEETVTTVCYGCGDDGYGNTWDIYDNTINVLENSNISLAYPSPPITAGSMTVQVIGSNNADISYNLPTHDRIRFYTNNATLTNISWEYSIDAANNFLTIPNTGNSISADFSAYDIFGDSCVNYLGQTIYIRAKYSINAYDFGYTFITPMTIRLSSPHISSIVPTPVSCFGEANGSMRVKFDRNLLPNEKINILVKNNDTQVDYSALNLTASNLSVATDSNYVLTWLNYPPWYSYTLVVGAPYRYYQWLQELPVGDYDMSLIGKYNNINTYTGSPQHFGNIQINQPPEQGFQTAILNNVLCRGGNTGNAILLARGGVGSYKYGLRHETQSTFIWKNFTTYGTGTATNHITETINGLSKGRYFIKMRDGNNCILRDTAGDEVVKFFDITEPAEELKVELLDVTQITAYDSINGAIRVKLRGGTPRIGEPITLPVYKYLHQWKDSATNTIINTYTLDTLGGKYETKIKNLPGGTYYFEATDRYYNPDTTYNYQGCRIFLKVVLKKPDPLLVNIIKQQPVRCNGRTDAVLRAAATGGVIDSLGYSYKWFKMVAGSFVQQTSTDSLLSDVGIGQYKVEVLDKYNNFKASSTYTLTEPTQLIANATTTQSSCFSNADGTALGSATGGTMPYRFQWSNSDLTPLMDSVPGGTYFLLVTDSLGCEITKQVSITSPIDMQTNIALLPIKCNNENNGGITVVPSGGTAPYQYTWSTGALNVNNIQNLDSGKYWIRTKDNNNCTKTDTISIVKPVKYSITAGPDRVVCPSQTIPLTATIVLDSASVIPPTLTYQWLGPVGFTTSTLKTVNTLRPGTYFLSATNTTGCIKRDTLVVTYNATSAVPEFIVSTQAYVGENVLLANLSNPVPDSVKWIVPAGATILSQSRSFCELKFADTGRFNVAIQNFYPSGCVYTKNKNINVTTNNTFNNLGNQANAFLKLFRVYPNPTSGAFTVELVFNGITKARIRMVNTLTNFTVFDQVKEGQYSYTIPYSYPSITATTYIIVIETAKGNFIYKLIKA